MPCSDSPGYNEVQYIENPVNEKLKKKVDKLTALLCKACSELRGYGRLHNKELFQWYEEHEKIDREREEKARREYEEAQAKKRKKEHLASVKERLMTQLTDDEKEALGL